MRPFRDNLPHNVECEFLFYVDVVNFNKSNFFNFQARFTNSNFLLRDHVKPEFNSISTDWQSIIRAALIFVRACCTVSNRQNKNVSTSKK